MSPPYRIETERLVIRCWEPEDAPLLKEAVDSSLDHLRPWMPWAQFEPQTLDEKLELMRSFRGQFDLGANFTYGLFDSEESLEIGYWIHADAIGRGLATEVSAVLTRVGIEKCALARVDISVDPENERSLAIPRKLGYVEEGRLRRRLPPKEDGGSRRDQIMFSMLAEELPGSPCMRFDYVAYDPLGREL